MACADNADLQLKCLKFFIRLDKGDQALKTAQNLIKNAPDDPKTSRGIAAFKEFAQSSSTVNKVALKLFLEAIVP